MNRDGLTHVAADILKSAFFAALVCLSGPNGTTSAQDGNQFVPGKPAGNIVPSQNDATFTPDPYYSPEVSLDAPQSPSQQSDATWKPPFNTEYTETFQPSREIIGQATNQVRSLMENETWEPPRTPVEIGYDPSEFTHSPIPWLQQQPADPKPSSPTNFSKGAAHQPAANDFVKTTTEPKPSLSKSAVTQNTKSKSSAKSIIRANTISPVSSGNSKMLSNSFAQDDSKPEESAPKPAPSQTFAPALSIERPSAGNSNSSSKVSGVARRDDRQFIGGSNLVANSPSRKPAKVTANDAKKRFASNVNQPNPKFKAQREPSIKSREVSTTTTMTTSAEAFERTQLLALVGGEPIFVGDALLQANQLIEQQMGAAPESVKARERRGLIKLLLPKLVDEKILYVGALQDLPEEANVEEIVASAAKEFDEKALPDLLKQAKVEDASDYDAMLRKMGSSLRKRRDAWARDQLTRYFISEQLDLNREITHQQLLDEYRANVEDYKIAEKAKWEQIMVRWDRFSSRDEARKQIVELGNRVIHGASLSALAQKSSHGFRADKGGQHDWTGRNALVLKEIDKAIFTLPIGKLSDVIETRDGLHIVRVVDRQEAGIKPFTEAQIDIKKRLKQKMREDAFEEHLAKLKEKIPVEYYTLESNDVASRSGGSFLE